MKRLFAAIKIHPSARFISVLNAISASLSHERIKWVEPENMHLTLKFFGETAENKIPAMKADRTPADRTRRVAASKKNKATDSF